MSTKSRSESTRHAGEPPPGAQSGVWSIDYRRGYEDGHRQATQDVLALLVTVSEEFLGAGVRSDEARRLVYAYERHLERRFEEIAGRGHHGGAPPPLQSSGDGAPAVPPS